MSSAEFFNKYVENLNSEIMEATKQKLMLKTQLAMVEETVAAQAKKIEDLEAALDKASAKNKKIKEDPSSTF